MDLIGYLGYLSLIILIINSTINLLWLHVNRLRKNEQINNQLLSILIPARNEEENIENCLNSIVNQSYKNIEVIIVDDNSTDNTYDLINKYSDKLDITIIKNNIIPVGWVAKNYLCHIMAKKCKGSVLLFLDADTVFLNNFTIEYSLNKISSNTDALSLILHQRLDSIWEKMIIPFRINYLAIFFLPMWMTTNYTAAAQGNFIMIKKSVYETIGGHSKFKKEICEDLAVIRFVRKYGYKTLWLDGTNYCETRMYESLGEINEGFIKNYYPNFFGSILFIAFFVYLHFIIIISILIFNYYSLINLILLLYIMFLTNWIFKTSSILSIILFPIGMIYNIVLLIKSTYNYVYKKRIKWSGREYVID